MIVKHFTVLEVEGQDQIVTGLLVGRICSRILLWKLGFAGVPWFVDIPLSPLSPSSHGTIMCVCVPKCPLQKSTQCIALLKSEGHGIVIYHIQNSDLELSFLTVDTRKAIL
jgi:hypothetical protein